MERFYGVPALESLADAETLTAAMRRAYLPGLYRSVLKDACRIRMALNFGALTDDPEFFAPVLFCTHYAEATKATIQGLEDSLGRTLSTVSRYVDAIRADLERCRQQGLRGIKFHFAYLRDLHFAPQTAADADRVFQRVLEEGYGWRPFSLGYQETRPLQDFLVHRIIEIAIDLDVPVVFHTGLQAHTGHNADDARPLRLWNLPQRFRRARFVILHSGMPWLEEAAMLAKHYPNCWLDMGWDHLMSPEISTRALRSWIDLVPMNKIFGFGGDYSVVEKVYGHLVLARQDIARALAARMAQDGMSRERAEAWIRALLVDNPTHVYRLQP
jgi:predicted TIM-barrel fold metal-dependent hydrolase